MKITIETIRIPFHWWNTDSLDFFEIEAINETKFKRMNRASLNYLDANAKLNGVFW